ncbi:MAG: HAD-IIIC family phosphatase [Janthinobacterium lividum]
MSLNLSWLPESPAWREQLDAARQGEPQAAFAAFQQLAATRMDFIRAGQLDKAVQRYIAEHGSPALPTIRLALLGSSTFSHLLPGIRLGALRRGLLVELYTGPYGLYRQELADPTSGLHAFRPEIVCFAFDAQHLAGSEGATVADAMANLRTCWQAAQALGATVLQQTVLPRLPLLMGNNEDRLQTSPAAVVQGINQSLREQAKEHGVYLLSVDTMAAQDGLAQWFEPALWYSAKQEIHPRATVVYGDQMGRLLAALRGRSAKCLVLDLDNTLWGGVIGDDGMDGIALGQGSPTGEAFIAFQRYAKQLGQRGVILAVCSKNDLENAAAPFDSHTEMILRRADIACFVANWQDKAQNLRFIAETLNIGLDSLVFVDDNPAERRLIRSELPMVAVPELPEDPAEYVSTLVDAGYFEAVELTAEDAKRTELYRANASREALRQTSTDLGSYLRGLDMELIWSPFDTAGFKRIVQLINKTNQFNLTTRRYTDAEATVLMANPDAMTLQLRLTDVHGDNGMIGVVIGLRTAGNSSDDESLLDLDTWLMSCRVLGRGVEEATLNLVCERARAMGCTGVVGHFRPSAKNSMVREHFAKLGFDLQKTNEDGSTDWLLPLDRFTERSTHMRVTRADTRADSSVDSPATAKEEPWTTATSTPS